MHGNSSKFPMHKKIIPDNGSFPTTIGDYYI
jgi:hypothetical protein